MNKYNLELSKIFDFLGNFKNLEIINEKDKNEIHTKIDNEIINYVKNFEDKFINNNNVDINNIESQEGNNNIKYFQRLNEIKKLIKNEISNDIITTWTENKNKYIFIVKEFIFNIRKLKEDIIKKMNSIQDAFISFLNKESDKEKIINLFIEKHNTFMENFSYIKNNKLVKEEVEKDIIEITEQLWKIIQLRKSNAIEELNNIRKKSFIGQKLEYFSDMLNNLFFSEAENYINKANIIYQFYYELENGNNNNNKKPEYKLKKSEIMKNTNNLEIYVPPPEKEVKKKKIKPRLKRYEDVKQEYLISPKIDKIYKNCFKLLFNYEKKMKEEGFISLGKDEYDIIKRRKKKSLELKKISNESINNDKFLLNPEMEMKTALNNEKIKFKLRITFLKFFGEKFLVKLIEIEKLVFENMDKWIIQSVDAQNNTMNEIINQIKENVLKNSFKEINNLILNENLDIFNNYEKVFFKFDEISIPNYKSLKEEDKKFDLNELYKIYLDLKLYEIQDNYITLDSLIDILFKKHIFDYNTKGLMKCFKELPYSYFRKFINKFKIKTSKEQNLIRIDRLFTILCLLNEKILDQIQLSKMIKQVKNRVKYNNYLSKDDFLNLKFWFDKKGIQKKVEAKSESLTSKRRRRTDFNSNKYSLFLIKERLKLSSSKKENKIPNSDINKKPALKNINLSKINSNNEMSLSEVNINEYSAMRNLKEILFMINKNYNNEINIFEFFDNLSLKFIIKFKRKITVKLKSKEKNPSIVNHDELNKIIKNGNDIKSDNNIKSDINNSQTYFEHLILN